MYLCMYAYNHAHRRGAREAFIGAQACHFLKRVRNAHPDFTATDSQTGVRYAGLLHICGRNEQKNDSSGRCHQGPQAQHDTQARRRYLSVTHSDLNRLKRPVMIGAVDIYAYRHTSDDRKINTRHEIQSIWSDRHRPTANKGGKEMIRHFNTR